MSTKKLNKRLARKWCDALESGEYDQCQGQLGEYDPVKDEDSFCCLGVLCIVEGFTTTEEEPKSWTGLSKEERDVRPRQLTFNDPKYKTDKALKKYGRTEQYSVPSWSKLNLPNTHMDKLVQMNDLHNKSFKQIAKYIRKHVIGE